MAVETRLPDALGVEPEQALQLYYYMLLTRGVEARIRKLYLQGKVVGGVYGGYGQEAIGVGSAFALGPGDTVSPIHRDMGVQLVRGMSVRRVMAHWMAREAGPTRGRDEDMHIGDLELGIFSPISMLGTSIPVAVGAALTFKQRGQNNVAMAYIGDGATNTGDFHEGVNFAATMRLPFVLIVENNQYAYSTPLDRQFAIAQIVDRAAAYGIMGDRVDGNDAIAVYHASQKAVQAARAGQGPTLIECVTMRMRGHSEHDPANYVPREMLEEWAQRDPIQAMALRLEDAGVMDENKRMEIGKRVDAEIDHAVQWADQQPFPKPEDVAEGLYASPID
ncbi:MAG TPA: thiamine pyrophosphate-dependent dehydrogenase E1 component subunit alpha [Chloroflexota bacterium]|nr:thiamine pyrophosphate-dependent dehydrogenase E1 component subunit alpha [Chloroflexota bacterium]